MDGLVMKILLIYLIGALVTTIIVTNTWVYKKVRPIRRERTMFFITCMVLWPIVLLAIVMSTIEEIVYKLFKD